MARAVGFGEQGEPHRDRPQPDEQPDEDERGVPAHDAAPDAQLA